MASLVVTPEHSPPRTVPVLHCGLLSTALQPSVAQATLTWDAGHGPSHSRHDRLCAFRRHGNIHVRAHSP